MEAGSRRRSSKYKNGTIHAVSLYLSLSEIIRILIRRQMLGRYNMFYDCVHDLADLNLCHICMVWKFSQDISGP